MSAPSGREATCECGDYRHQHAGPDNRGSCRVCRNGTPPPLGADGCQRFRESPPRQDGDTVSAPYRRPRRPAKSLPGIAAMGALTACPCGKATHRSRKTAKTFARQHHPAGGLSPYACPHNPNAWHLGHLPEPVIAGRVPRAYAQQARRA